MPSSRLEDIQAVIKAMTPRAESILETVRTLLSSNRPEFLLKNPDMALERIEWCQKIIEQVHARVHLNSEFMGHFAVTLDQSWALSVILEESTEPLEALYSFAIAVTHELFRTARELLPAETFKEFEALIDGDDRQALVNCISSQALSAQGFLLGRIFVFDLANTANMSDNACEAFEGRLELTLRAVLHGQVAQA